VKGEIGALETGRCRYRSVITARCCASVCHVVEGSPVVENKATGTVSICGGSNAIRVGIRIRGMDAHWAARGLTPVR